VSRVRSAWQLSSEEIFLATSSRVEVIREMDWKISPIARKSAHSVTEFEKDERVLSILAKKEDGELERFDVKEGEEADFQLPGDAVCKWTQIFKPKAKDNREEEAAMKLTADNLFINLFDGEEEPSFDNAKLKHMLALMLERKRLLRLKGKAGEYSVYVHRPTKNEYYVPHVELDPEFFIENQEKLAFLVEGGSASDDSAPRAAPEETKADQ